LEQFEKYLRFRHDQLEEIHPKKTALIIIDMQKYQVEKDWTVFKTLDRISPGILDYFVEEVEKKVVPNLKKLIDFCHMVKVPIIYTKYSSFMVDGSDLPEPLQKQNKLAKQFLGEVPYPHISHPSSEIIDALKPVEEDLVLQKNTSGTFISTRLDSFLRNMGVKTLLVAGVVTHFCVESTAREAADYGFQTIIIDDCCAGWTSELHKKTLQTFELLYGYILSHEEIIERISKKLKKLKPQSTTS